MRIVVADPPAYTPWYDHELATALAAKGEEVEVATSPFRFGELPAQNGYRRTEWFYPVSSRLFRRSRLRFPLKALEQLSVPGHLSRIKADGIAGPETLKALETALKNKAQ